MRVLSIFLVSLFLLFSSSCMQHDTVTLYLDQDHNWEVESGRRMWYSLLYSYDNEVNTLHISVGERQITLLLPLLQTHLFCAYPLGYLPPLGGAITPYYTSNDIFLRYEEGLLCDTLLRLVPHWGDIFSNLNYPKVLDEMRQSGSSLLDIDYFLVAKDLVNDEYDSSNITTIEKFSTTLDTLPSGRYLSSTPLIPSFYKGETKEVEIPSLPPGTHYFFNYSKKLLCVFIVGQEGESPISYYMKAPDSIFTISNKEYQILLERGSSSSSL